MAVRSPTGSIVELAVPDLWGTDGLGVQATVDEDEPGGGAGDQPVSTAERTQRKQLPVNNGSDHDGRRGGRSEQQSAQALESGRDLYRIGRGSELERVLHASVRPRSTQSVVLQAQVCRRQHVQPRESLAR